MQQKCGLNSKSRKIIKYSIPKKRSISKKSSNLLKMKAMRVRYTKQHCVLHISGVVTPKLSYIHNLMY